MTALLLFGDTARFAALRHEIPLEIIDALLFAERDGEVYVMTTRLERDRFAAALPDARLLDFFDFGLRALIDGGTPVAEAEREVVTRAIREIGIESAVVPGEFPVALADELRAAGISLVIDDATVALRRRVKSPAEMDGIRSAQRAAEAAMRAAADALAAARCASDGTLRHAGEDAPMLAQDVRAVAREAAARLGAPCPPDIIVASAWQGYGHDPGVGALPTGLPITVDLWPREESSGCWADMTRTFVVGRPRPEHAAAIEERVGLVAVALDAVKLRIRPGVLGREVYETACEVFEAAGYPTQRNSRGDVTDGFQFSLGHGVGLEVHEPPWLGLAGHDALIAGDVLALEPGLYSAELGDIRFEDLVLVTDEGCETLTDFPYELTPPPR